MIAVISFWSSVALILYAYAGYPAALTLLSIVRNRSIAKASVTPSVSFIITAHNEEARIRHKIDNTLRLDYPPHALEVIVASDCSTDQTDAIVGEYWPRVRLVRSSERNGKEAAQQLAVENARGDILVFSDVAAELDRDGILTMVANFADPTVGCVSSADRVIDAGGRPSGEGLYVRYEMHLRALETRVNSLVGLSGSFFAARREVCGRWAADRQSDFNTLLNAIRIGLRGVLDSGTVCYYRNIAHDRRELERKVRTVVRGLHVLSSNRDMLNPFRYGLFAWQLASHKLCRWLVPVAMIGAFISNLALLSRSHVYLGALIGQTAFYAVALAGLRSGSATLRAPSFLLQANVGVLVAWYRFLRGDRIASWTPSDRTQALPRLDSR